MGPQPFWDPLPQPFWDPLPSWDPSWDPTGTFFGTPLGPFLGPHWDPSWDPYWDPFSHHHIILLREQKKIFLPDYLINPEVYQLQKRRL